MLIKFNYKTAIQLSIIALIIIIIFFTYGYYNKSNHAKIYEDKEIQSNDDIVIKENIEQDNLIKKIEYNSNDINGNNYYIKAESGEMITDKSSSNAPNIILMNYVNAIITLNNSTKINISAKKAKYNLQNFNTEFSYNINASYDGKKMRAENLDYNFVESKIYAYDNIVLDNPINNTKLKADKVEIDLINKSTKILSENSSKNILIIKTQ